MMIENNQISQKSTIDEIMDHTTELPLVWQEKILLMAKGMKYAKESMNEKKNTIEKPVSYKILVLLFVYLL